MNIILTGMKHCGKSTHGRFLARKRGMKFVDSDDVLGDIFFEEHGQRLAVRDIYRALGERGFRGLERKVVERIMSSENDAVVALGGGLPASEKLRPLLKKLGFVVYLECPGEVLFRRIKAGGLPPFIDPERPFESFQDIFREREKYYLEIADMTVRLDDMPAGKSGEKVVQAIEGRIAK